MEIVLAKTAGFCFGVKRAVETVYSHVGEADVYTYGPIIHNDEVVEDLRDKGIRALYGPGELEALSSGTVIIRSHGVTREIYDLIEKKGLAFIDATCPFVKKIHKIAKRESEEGRQVVIIGNPSHPEVEGIKGWCVSPPIVLETLEEAENIPSLSKKEISIVSQTTFNQNKFKDLVEIIEKKGYDINVFNTICNATEERQLEAKAIAKNVDAMIVIGGKHSSNTQKLYEISKNECSNTIFIQTVRDLDTTQFSGAGRIGITAGASTPNNIIKEVHISMSENNMEVMEENEREGMQESEGMEENKKEETQESEGTQQDKKEEMLESEGTQENAKEAVQENNKAAAEENENFEQLLEENLVTIRNGEIVSGTIIDVKEDEIILNIGYKADGIITRNEYSNTPNLDLTKEVKVGDTMEAKVLKVNDGEGQVLLTYKRLAAEKGNKRLEEAFNTKEVLTAKVEQVLDGGLSVSVEGTRVFIPASLVSDTYEKNLGKYANREINFVISEFNPRKRRIIGDRKQLLVAEKLEKQKELFAKIYVGMEIEGVVKNVTDFGAFIDLGGADGLLHISEMSWGRVENPRKVFSVGQELKVLIKDIQGEKIALSLKFPDTNPWLHAAEKYAVGNVVTGKVARMTDFGAFIELETGVDALLHVSQIAKEHIDKPSDVLKVGQEIRAKVVDFRKDEKKISLSVKALLNDEARNSEA